MSDLKNADGGAAFPYSKPTVHYEGMSLRDYFAGMALQGLLSANVPMRGMTDNNCDELMAREAYRSADAMLQERMKPKP